MVLLPNGYAIDCDKYGYVVGKLVQRVVKEKNEDGIETMIQKTVITDCKYYSLFDNAVESAKEMMIRQDIKNNTYELNEAVEAIRKISKSVKDAIEKATRETDE